MPKPQPGIDTLHTILSLLESLEDDVRDRMLKTIDTYFSRTTRPHTLSAPRSEANAAHDAAVQGRRFGSVEFSDDRSLDPKQFIFEKQPQTDVERIACLGYYLTHYRSTPHFKTLDISKLNTEAAQAKFSNTAYAMNNAIKTGYLAVATKGARQMSAAGERFVLALPDRDRARAEMAARSRRKRAKLRTKTQDRREEK